MSIRKFFRILYVSQFISGISGGLLLKAGYEPPGYILIAWVFVAMFIQLYFVLQHAKECCSGGIN